MAPAGTTPPGMIRIPASGLSLALLGSNYTEQFTAEEYLIDEHEVTNREYKEFVDAGGYQTRTYWKEPVIVNGQTLSWEEAIALFRDQTGRAGPSTWEVGTYPRGADDLPVGGVSWFEAAAYAAFRGKHLPTVYHWATAAGPLDAAHVVPRSNFSNKGPIAVKTSGAVSRFGLHDAAGNVREWCANELPPGQRYILGGAWNDPDYMFFHAHARPPLDRSPQNGFRGVSYPSPSSVPAATTRPVVHRLRDYRAERPVSDDVFKVFKDFLSYDAVALDSRVEHVTRPPKGDMSGSRLRPRTDRERVIAHLYLPKRVKPPFQTVLFWPGANAIRAEASANALDTSAIGYVVTSGRALLVPVLLGTYRAS